LGNASLFKAMRHLAHLHRVGARVLRAVMLVLCASSTTMAYAYECKQYMGGFSSAASPWMPSKVAAIDWIRVNFFEANPSMCSTSGGQPWPATYTTYSNDSDGWHGVVRHCGAGFPDTFYGVALSTRTGDHCAAPAEPEFCPSEDGAQTYRPILPASGEKLYTQGDFAGTGPHALSLVRTFRSRWSLAGLNGFASSPGLGISWAHNHSSSLSLQTNGSVVSSISWQKGDGSIRTFQPAGGNLYKDAAGASTITAAAAGANGLPSGYSLQLADDDSTWQFNATGRLLATTERNGWTTSYSYIASGNGAGQLGQVTNAFGRSISFAYNAAGQLTSATMPDGQVISYTLDSSARLLTVGYPGDVSRTTSTRTPVGPTA
jgi:YD repeat-containing protein